MKHQLHVLLSLLTWALGGCQASPLAQPSAVADVTKVFGPVIGQEVIRGREQTAGEVLLLTGSAIVRVDLEGRRAVTTPIALERGEACWGLAALADGSVWTLQGRSAVIRVEADGSVSRVIPLEEPHAGLFASGDRLIFQKAVGSATEPALFAGVPGSTARAAWSEMTMRSVPGIARAQASALSLVACGQSATPERPCWFPDEAAVSLIAADGATRRIALSGLPSIAPEVLLTAENPRRPVRDAYVDAQSRIWVLSSGDAPPRAMEIPGGWLLARYRADGTPDGQVRLAQPVRLLLRVEPRRLIVLAGSGDVSEVTSW